MEIWSKIQSLAAANNDESNKAIRQHVLEAQRLTSAQRNLRIVTENITVDGQTFNKGDQVVCLLVGYQPGAHRSVPFAYDSNRARHAKTLRHSLTRLNSNWIGLRSATFTLALVPINVWAESLRSNMFLPSSKSSLV